MTLTPSLLDVLTHLNHLWEHDPTRFRVEARLHIEEGKRMGGDQGPFWMHMERELTNRGDL